MQLAEFSRGISTFGAIFVSLLKPLTQIYNSPCLPFAMYTRLCTCNLCVWLDCVPPVQFSGHAAAAYTMWETLALHKTTTASAFLAKSDKYVCLQASCTMPRVSKICFKIYTCRLQNSPKGIAEMPNSIISISIGKVVPPDGAIIDIIAEKVLFCS